jgi:hypothetical protein
VPEVSADTVPSWHFGLLSVVQRQRVGVDEMVICCRYQDRTLGIGRPPFPPDLSPLWFHPFRGDSHSPDLRIAFPNIRPAAIRSILFPRGFTLPV